MLDGVNPFGNQSTTWSTWLILILNYNLPPWMTTKKFFLMLALLIPEKKSVKICNIDVYMVPLLIKLQLLWSGVDAWDITRLVGQQSFKMHGILMWAICDLLVYGLFLGQVTKGYKGCMACGPNTCSCHSQKLCKTTYVDHHRWLPLDHPYQRNARDFNGKYEKRLASNVMQGFQVLDHVNDDLVV